ncbi:uncharacterized protein LOC106168529 [Lingula anatina]|uniref:Uncharacterized protein LOC106168529 n=1 Tax=Lingula anatina TaxID=7574 RepID=A0A1S3IYJ0_LINAN|nr:uncharacterized protein LOC106168529 [Lingula anatina]XP_013403078.1 uncharacterized protein LOC106168529 [Lingula anatina]XP_013403080.1 uncharacterized protein LOC106168529 [Lingula anatina]XP_013403081.1 uncharacterized protein LOC106168529 [Lingula anatina]|eukprot:XP_013403077.1 uncharacterized protein LOC106168529 [Lingula anatina]
MHRSHAAKSVSHIRRQVEQVILCLENTVAELRFLSQDIKILGKQIDVVTDRLLEDCPLNSLNVTTTSFRDATMITLQDSKTPHRLPTQPLGHRNNSRVVLSKEQMYPNSANFMRKENTYEDTRSVGSDKENVFSSTPVKSVASADLSLQSSIEDTYATETSGRTVIATLHQNPNQVSMSSFISDNECHFSRAFSSDTIPNGESSPNNNSNAWEFLHNEKLNKDQPAETKPSVMYPVSPNNNSTGFSFVSEIDEKTGFLVGNEIYNENLKAHNGKYLSCDTCMLHHGVLRQDRIDLLFKKMEIEKAFDKVGLEDKKLQDSVNFSGGFLKQLHEKCNQYDQNCLSGSPSLKKKALIGKDIPNTKSQDSNNSSANVLLTAGDESASGREFNFCVLPKEVEYSGLYEYVLDMTLETMSDDGHDSNFDEWSEDEGSISLDLEYSASYNRDMNTWTSFALVHVDSVYEDDFEYENLGACCGETSGLDNISPTTSRKTYPGNWENDLEELALTYCSPRSKRKHYL